jgi:hypothetical protein
MTKEEHQLIIGLFAKQLQLYKTLMTILESRGIVESDDLQAYHVFTASSGKTTDELINHAKLIYRTIAVPLGLDVPEDIV